MSWCWCWARSGGVVVVVVDGDNDTLTESCEGAMGFMVMGMNGGSLRELPVLVSLQVEVREKPKRLFHQRLGISFSGSPDKILIANLQSAQWTV